MNYDRGVGFIGGFILGGLGAGAVMLLFAPASGKETREQIRFESVAFKHRSQVLRDDKRRQAKKMIKQRQKDVSHAQARLGDAIDDRKDYLREAVNLGKQAASTRKDEIRNRSQNNKALASI